MKRRTWAVTAFGRGVINDTGLEPRAGVDVRARTAQGALRRGKRQIRRMTAGIAVYEHYAVERR